MELLTNFAYYESSWFGTCKEQTSLNFSWILCYRLPIPKTAREPKAGERFV